MRKILDTLLTVMLRLTSSALVTALTAPALIEAAARERRYFAIGGEWLLIIVIAVGGWIASGYIIKEAEKHG